MKFRFTVTVDIEDPGVYNLDDEGWAVGAPTARVDHPHVGEYVADAVASWGGQFAPGDPLFPANIRRVHVRGGRGDNAVDLEVTR